MNRRDFLRRSALIASGVVAADQLEILERLNHRKIFALGDIPDLSHYGKAEWPATVPESCLDALLQEDYVRDGIRDAVNSTTPFTLDHIQRARALILAEYEVKVHPGFLPLDFGMSAEKLESLATTVLRTMEEKQFRYLRDGGFSI